MKDSEIIVPVAGIVVLALLLLPAMCSLSRTADEIRQQNVAADAKPAPPRTKDPEAVRGKINAVLAAKGEAMVRTILKDPGLAVFSQTMGRVKRGKWVACGYVNSKNSFGAMVGDTEWVALPTDGRAYIDDGRGGPFTRTWNHYCTGLSDAVDHDITPAHVAIRELKQKRKSCGKVTEAKDLPDGGVEATCSNKKTYKFNYIWETGDYLLISE